MSLPTVVTVTPNRTAAGRGIGASGHRPGLHRGAHLRAHQRLSQGLAYGYRQPGEEGSIAGRNRDAGSRPAADPGRGRSRDGARQRGPVANHQHALEGLLATESVSKQDADEKAGDAAAKKSGRRFRRRQRVAAARARVVQAGRGAVRRRHHRAQYRHRSVDQCRSKRRIRTVPDGRYAKIAHIRASAGALCRGCQSGTRGGAQFQRTAGQGIYGNCGAHLERTRSRVAHLASRAGIGQCAARALSRRLCRGAFQARRKCAVAAFAGQHGAVSGSGIAGGDGRRASARFNSRASSKVATSAAPSRCCRASMPTMRW